MWIRTITISALLLAGLSQKAQEVLYPLNANPVLMALEQEERGLKSAKAGAKLIPVDMDSSDFIIIEDFSFNSPRPDYDYWEDNNVYVNRSFPIQPVTIGVATFDGLDEWGYPYNFITSNAYGACDTLTSHPIELGKVDANVHHPVYLSFSFQAQGINPFFNSPGDSFLLEFFLPFEYDTTIITDTLGNKDTIVTADTINLWTHIWSHDGYNLHASDTSCNYAMKKVTLKVDPVYYQDGFRLRFRRFGNQGGSVDHWHLDFVVLSSDSMAHNGIGDYAFRYESASLIKDYEAMPWFHFRPNRSRYEKTSYLLYKTRNTFNENVEVDMEYRAYNSSKAQIDSVVVVAVTPIPKLSCKLDTVPLPPDLHRFIFPESSAPLNSTTYFTASQILKRRIGPIDLIQQNNEVTHYQVFGTYYAYDDGTAEAGYGVKSDKGKLAIRFVLAPGISDTLTGIYIYFNPVVIDRSGERFRLTVWGNNAGEPGNIIYESDLISSPYYPKLGVNYFVRMELEEELIVSDTFYIGYQMVTEEVLNIGYDMNRKNNDKVFYSTGGPWINSGTAGGIPSGTVMMRPAFRRLSEPVYGVKDISPEAEALLHIFPNPATDYITLAMALNDGREYSAQIAGADGRIVTGFSFTGSTQVDISAYPSGIYFVKIISSGGASASGKFLVIH